MIIFSDMPLVFLKFSVERLTTCPIQKHFLNFFASYNFRQMTLLAMKNKNMILIIEVFVEILLQNFCASVCLNKLTKTRP